MGWAVLKKRIIPVQLLIRGRLVKTREFDTYRDVGDPVASSRVYNAQNADELVFLNIDRGSRRVDEMLTMLERVSEACFMPLALGGGIATAADAARLIRNGADKVVVNSAAYADPTILSRIADEFGAQAVIASLDARFRDGAYELYSDCGRKREPIGLAQHLDRCIQHGAGEVLINSIDRDGTMQGYDVPLIDLVVRQSPVPVIACGGAGHYNHLKDAFTSTGVSALACGSLFNFGDNNPIRAKAFLSNYGIPFKVI
jgi:cyclase